MKLREKILTLVSTHSRLKAAGTRHTVRTQSTSVSTHSRLKAAGRAVASVD